MTGRSTSGALPAASTPRLRRLSDEEIELWTSVATSVTPRPGSTLPLRATMPPPAIAGIEGPPAEARIAPASAKPTAPPPLARLDRKLKQKLSRGRATADAAIDLHGFRQAEAYSALRHFLQRAQREGARVVLVVTGKGLRQGDPYGIGGGEFGALKRAVPLWLALPDFRAMVVGFEEAGRPHGGAGALYVRLRRRDRPA